MKKLTFVIGLGLLSLSIAGIRGTGSLGSNSYTYETGTSSEVYYYGKQLTPNQILTVGFDSVGDWKSLTRTDFTASSGNIAVSLNYKDFLSQGVLSTNVLGAYGNITIFPTSYVEFQIGNPVGITINVTGNIKISN